MMTLLNIFGKLKKYHKGDYRQFALCFLLSVTLVSALTMFMLSPFVQSRLPEGGDSRKVLYMVYAVAVTGCALFVVYATGLFLRFKSREAGILMALGTRKSILAKTLMNELLLLTGKLTVLSILAGSIMAFGFGKAYEHFIESTENDYFVLSLSGVLVSVVFAAAAMCMILVMAGRFMNRINLIEILNEERRTEPLQKSADQKYLLTGLAMIGTGVFFGLVVPFVTGTMFKIKLGTYTYAFYILVFIGLYRMMVYSVAVHKRGKNPGKYYKHLISFGMMKFQGVSVVRNMLIITLLLAGGLFVIFYSATNFIQGAYTAESEENDVSYRYLGNADRLTEEEVRAVALKYGVQIKDYREAEFIRLLGSGVFRENYDSDGRLIEEYRERDFYKNFISAGQFAEVTGIDARIEPGDCLYINREGNVESYWFLPEDLDLAENTDTGVKKELSCTGSVNYSSFFYNRGMDGNACYILNDEDFEALKEGISDRFQMTQVLFNLEETGDTYGFSRALYKEYCDSAPDNMRVMGSYDEFRSVTDEDYDYGEMVLLKPERPETEVDWKYAPVLVPLSERNFLLSYTALLLIFLFVAVICFAAAGVIGYTRSIMVAIKSRLVLMDVKKLGAEDEYLNRILKEQVRKVFVLPTAAAEVFMFVYYTLILWQNDGTITANEYPMIAFNAAVCLLLAGFQSVLYRVSLKKASETVFHSGQCHG